MSKKKAPKQLKKLKVQKQSLRELSPEETAKAAGGTYWSDTCFCDPSPTDNCNSPTDMCYGGTTGACKTQFYTGTC